MPTPSHSSTGPRLSRRAALAGLAAVVGAATVGCTSESDDGRGRDTAPEPKPSLDPDIAVAAEALANQQTVIALLEATVDRHPKLKSTLAPALDAHRAHEAMLSRAVPDDVPVSPSTSTPTSSPSDADTATSSPAGTPAPAVPRKTRRAVAHVVAAERELATTTKRHAFRAQSGAFARLLGSMAAASAQYATVLSTEETA